MRPVSSIDHRWWLLCVGALVAGWLVASTVAVAAPNDTLLVSRGIGGVKGNAGSGDASISGNGRFIAFSSGATNLTPISSGADVYVRDVLAGTTALVSVAEDGGAANDRSGHPSISADGRFVAFESDASNLHPDVDEDVSNQLYLRDLQFGTTELLSRAPDGTPATGAADQPAISPNGRYVAFVYFGMGLSPADTDLTPDVYVRDLTAGTTTLVSRATGAAGAKANGLSGLPSVSSTGRVAFSSNATNLGVPGPGPKVYVRDLATSTTTLASRATGAAGMAATAANAAISGDGRHVAFAGLLFPLGPQVYVRDLQSATTTLVSRADGPAGAPADAGGGPATAPSISADGRYIAFDSPARNLDPADTDSTADVFLRDMTAQTTILMSRASQAGAKGNASSRRPRLAAGGGFVAFESQATNLSPDDSDSLLDVFRREIGPDLGPADGDGDGVPDAADRCPTVPAANPDGCPKSQASDSDGDGIPDAADRCPTVPAANPDGCPAPGGTDRDADGVPDATDRCPTVPAATSDGCPRGATQALEASLARAGRALRRLGIRGLLRKRAVKVAVEAPAAGRLQAAASANIRGGRATLAKRVAVLKGARTFATARRAKVKLTLTRKGRRALSRARRAKLRLTLTFLDVADRTFTASAIVRLKR